jgi:hypothetical protein
MSQANESRANHKFSEKMRLASEKAKAEKAAKQKTLREASNRSTAQPAKPAAE